MLQVLFPGQAWFVMDVSQQTSSLSKKKKTELLFGVTRDCEGNFEIYNCGGSWDFVLTDPTACPWQIVAVSMVSVTTGLAVGECVSPGPARKATLGNSVTRHPRTVVPVGCPSTATSMLSAASMTQQGQSLWHLQGHIAFVQAHGCHPCGCVCLCTWCTGWFQ